MPALTDLPVPDDEAVHGWFGLSYANYLVLPRTFLQSMPAEWQRRLVGCLEELDAAYAGEDRADSYEVIAGISMTIGDLDDEYLTMIGITSRWDQEVRRHVYLDSDGHEVDEIHRVVVPYPAGDPTPHYDRGRTRVAPDLDAVARVRAERQISTLLALEMEDNDAGAATVGDYLIALLGAAWESGEGFSAKRPFGNSGWERELFLPLVRAGQIEGTIVDGRLESCDSRRAHALIADAIRALRPTA